MCSARCWPASARPRSRSRHPHWPAHPAQPALGFWGGGALPWRRGGRGEGEARRGEEEEGERGKGGEGEGRYWVGERRGGGEGKGKGQGKRRPKHSQRVKAERVKAERVFASSLAGRLCVREGEMRSRPSLCGRLLQPPLCGGGCAGHPAQIDPRIRASLRGWSERRASQRRRQPRCVWPCWPLVSQRRAPEVTAAPAASRPQELPRRSRQERLAGLGAVLVQAKTGNSRLSSKSRGRSGSRGWGRCRRCCACLTAWTGAAPRRRRLSASTARAANATPSRPSAYRQPPSLSLSVVCV